MLGSKIKEYRRQYNYSQRDLAELLNVSAKSVGRWEQNKTKPSVDELKLLADIFGISEAELLRDDNELNMNSVESALDKISDGVDNLVTGQDEINKTIMTGQDEYKKTQAELILELRNQNAELLKKIENSNRSYNIQKELLKQKKIRTVIFLVTCIIIILFVFITWIYVLNHGLNKDHIIEGSIVTGQQTYFSDDD